jgi:alkylation response protein AidB-like acyl-CoA dehydrogenase
MDLSYGPDYETFRDDVHAFLAEAWPQGRAVDGSPHEQQQRFILDATARGYMYRSIPRRFGGSEQPFDPLREAIVSEEFDRAGAPWRLGLQGVGMIVPTLLEVGADWQREKFIAPTLRGDYTWCQGYSEPNAGSDLASLRSSARLEGDEWIINGQKIWTSDATDAGYMFGMFRTEPDAPKHGGISYLLLEMDQPGIEVRPLRQITGSTHFFEVFFDDARTPADWIVGRRGEGWQVARVNLKHERTLSDGSRARNLFRQLVALASRTSLDGQPATRDPMVRQRLAELECYVRCTETMTLRRLSAAARGEEDKTVAPTLVNKLFGSDVTERMVRLAYDLIGADGLRAPTDATWGTSKEVSESTDWIDQYLYSLAARIAAGSSNIQRNIIGERILGLPRDLQVLPDLRAR